MVATVLPTTTFLDALSMARIHTLLGATVTATEQILTLLGDAVTRPLVGHDGTAQSDHDLYGNSFTLQIC